MNRIKHPNQPFIGGAVFYTQPETKETFHATIFDQLVAKVVAHRKANGLPVGLGIEDEIEQHVCRERPEVCVNSDPNIPQKRRLSMTDVLRGTKVMATFLAAGSPTVDPEEAKRRAALCAKCPYNVTFSLRCGGLCGELKTLVHAIVGGRSTGFENELKSCSICACYTSASVWLPLEIQCKGVPETMRNQFAKVACWKRCDQVGSGESS